MHIDAEYLQPAVDFLREVSQHPQRGALTPEFVRSIECRPTFVLFVLQMLIDYWSRMPVGGVNWWAKRAAACKRKLFDKKTGTATTKDLFAGIIRHYNVTFTQLLETYPPVSCRNEALPYTPSQQLHFNDVLAKAYTNQQLQFQKCVLDMDSVWAYIDLECPATVTLAEFKSLPRFLQLFRFEYLSDTFSIYDIGQIYSKMVRINAQNRKEITCQTNRRPNQQTTDSQLYETMAKMHKLYVELFRAARVEYRTADANDARLVAKGELSQTDANARQQLRADQCSRRFVKQFDGVCTLKSLYIEQLCNYSRIAYEADCRDAELLANGALSQTEYRARYDERSVIWQEQRQKIEFKIAQLQV